MKTVSYYENFFNSASSKPSDPFRASDSIFIDFARVINLFYHYNYS
jgi:hypothetical protein